MFINALVSPHPRGAAPVTAVLITFVLQKIGHDDDRHLNVFLIMIVMIITIMMVTIIMNINMTMVKLPQPYSPPQPAGEAMKLGKVQCGGLIDDDDDHHQQKH